MPGSISAGVELAEVYTSRGHGCGKYSELIFVESKALKLAHSWLRNGFSNVAIGSNQPLEIRSRDRAKYTFGVYSKCSLALDFK